jgi:hypothetical protein
MENKASRKFLFNKLSSVGIILAVLILMNACDDSDPFSFVDDFSMVPEPFDTVGVAREIRSNGLVIYTQDLGSGDFAITERDRVFLFYTMRRSDGTIIQSTYANGRVMPNEFLMGNTIRGFREGLIGLKEGGMRTLVIPPALGYGNDPRHALSRDTLFYDVLIDIIAE